MTFGMVFAAMSPADPAHAATVNENSFGIAWGVNAVGEAGNASDNGDEGGRSTLATGVAAQACGYHSDDTLECWQNSASVRANHAAGTIGLNTGNDNPYSSGDAFVQLVDTLTFNLLANDPSEVFDIGFSAIVQGSAATWGFPIQEYGSSLQFTFQADACVAAPNTPCVSTDAFAIFSEYSTANPTYTTTTDGDATGNGNIFNGTISLQGGNVYDVRLSSTMSGAGRAFFGDTAYLNVTGAPSYTSASTVFLTQPATPPAPIPLPASAWLIGLGFLGLFGTRRLPCSSPKSTA